MIPLTLFFIFLWREGKVKGSSIPKKLFSAFSIAIYSLHPSILSSLININRCEEFDFGSHLQNYLTENCGGTRYLSFNYFFVWPFLFLFAFIIPIFLLIFLIIKKNKIYEQAMLQKLGFLLTGYKTHKFYW